MTINTYKHTKTIYVEKESFEINLSKTTVAEKIYYKAECDKFPYLDEYAYCEWYVLVLIADSIKMTLAEQKNCE